MHPSRMGRDLIRPPPQDRMGVGNEGSLDTRPLEPLCMPESEARVRTSKHGSPRASSPERGGRFPLHSILGATCPVGWGKGGKRPFEPEPFEGLNPSPKGGYLGSTNPVACPSAHVARARRRCASKGERTAEDPRRGSGNAVEMPRRRPCFDLAAFLSGGSRLRPWSSEGDLAHSASQACRAVRQLSCPSSLSVRDAGFQEVLHHRDGHGAYPRPGTSPLIQGLLRPRGAFEHVSEVDGKRRTKPPGMAPTSDAPGVAQAIVVAFLKRTRVSQPWQSGTCGPRYLWTDAFAVCLLLGLHWRGFKIDWDKEEPKEAAVELVKGVHGVLGKKRVEGTRGFAGTSSYSETEGWLSQDRNQPTARGLRIGKKLPERKLQEPYDEELEWERDGQYFHYLTKWMHALAQLAAATNNSKYAIQAAQLIKGVHWEFARGKPGGRHLAWKMSTDLSRALVPTQGHTDPLDGFIAYRHVQATLLYFGLGGKYSLESEIEDIYSMVKGKRFDTSDVLGIGCLLVDACKVMHLCIRRNTLGGDGYDKELPKLLVGLLRDAQTGLVRVADDAFRQPANHRLAFREFGLSTGLQALPLMQKLLLELQQVPEKRGLSKTDVQQVESLLSHLIENHFWMVQTIHDYWAVDEHRRGSSWISHLDINEVMWATSLVPDGFLEMLF